MEQLESTAKYDRWHRHRALQVVKWQRVTSIGYKLSPFITIPNCYQVITTSEHLGNGTCQAIKRQCEANCEEWTISSVRTDNIVIFCSFWTLAYISLSVIRLQRMRKMLTILTNVRSVCKSVCLSRGSSRLHCAKLAEQIKMLFGVNTPGGRWNIVLDVGPDPPTEGKRDPPLNFGTPLYFGNG